MNDCPSCLAAPAIKHITLGLLPCETCKARQDKLPRPKQSPEVIQEYIKEERKERQDSIEQPHFKGELNKRYVDLWGEQVARDKGFTDKEIKNAKYVYDGTPLKYYKEST